MSMSILITETIELKSENDIVSVWQFIKKLTAEYNFRLLTRTMLATAVGELARNTITHGGGGIVIIDLIADSDKRGIRACFIDNGPGIPDINLALKDGYTTTSGLGLGLGGAKRLVDEFNIESKQNEGTKVTIIKWK